MSTRTNISLSFLAVVLFSCAAAIAEPPVAEQPAAPAGGQAIQESAAEPTDGQPSGHPGGPEVMRLRGPAGRPGQRLTEEQETELLEFLKERRPSRYEEIIKLSNEDPRRYRFVTAHMWQWYQQWKHMSSEAQDAAIVEHDLRVETYLALSRWHDETDPQQKEKLKGELRTTLERHFEAEQKLRQVQLAELEQRIEDVRQEIQQREQDRTKIVDERLNRMLRPRRQRQDEEKPDGPAPPPEGEEPPPPPGEIGQE